MFNPLTGRFIQSDPIGFDAGDVNLYRYVGNNPTNALDPSGTEEWTEEEARTHLQKQARTWYDRGWKYPSNLLAHFLNDGNTHSVTDEELQEIQEHFAPFVQRMLIGEAQGYVPGKTYTVTRKKLPIRFTSGDNPLIAAGEAMIAKEAICEPNEYLFAAFGGVRLTMVAEITAVREVERVNLLGLKYTQRTFDASVWVVLEDTYDFEPTGPRNIRLQFASYSAAHYLQMEVGKPKYKKFDNSAKFTAKYTNIPIIPPRDPSRP